MAKKKSNAQVKRLQKRAADRGEVYIADTSPPQASSEKVEGVDGETGVRGVPQDGVDINENSGTSLPQSPLHDSTALTLSELKPVKPDASKRKEAAERLQNAMKQIEVDDTLRAKDRRSAKRQAEALALEASGMPAQDLLDWYRQHQVQPPTPKHEQGPETKKRKRTSPCIAFVGQLSYHTTKEGLFHYLRKELGDTVTPDSVKIRLLTKNGKSRGMAFVETSSPELLFSCLSLHHTYLDGRRINIERTVGGSDPAKRQSKLDQIRQDQQSHLNEVIEGILEQHGLREGQGLDQPVLLQCLKHAPSVVQAALERFVESNGLDKDNPSAYLTFLLEKIGKEGIILKDKARTQDDSRKQRRAPHFSR